MNTKSIGLLLIVIALFSMYLHGRNKFIPALHVITDKTATDTGVTTGKILFAFFMYLILLSFLDEDDGYKLTGMVILGGLFYNFTTRKDQSLLVQLGKGLK